MYFNYLDQDRHLLWCQTAEPAVNSSEKYAIQKEIIQYTTGGEKKWKLSQAVLCTVPRVTTRKAANERSCRSASTAQVHADSCGNSGSFGGSLRWCQTELQPFQFLMQRLSVTVQRGNAAWCILGTVHKSLGLDTWHHYLSIDKNLCR